MTDRSGEQFGDYLLLSQLGTGTFGEVYEAEQIYLKTRVAIKILSQLDQAESQHFLEEARKVAALEHPHIVRVLSFSIQEHIPYLVMQLAPRGSLKDLLTSSTAQLAAHLLPYLQQAAEGLHYAHEQRMIHLDIKPANLLLSAKQQILLADFGLALSLQPQRTHQTVRSFSGTPAYAAPEQFQNKPGLASDQYALGVIAYRWLTGSLPFQGDWFAIGHQKLSEEPPLLRTRAPGISPAVEQVVRQALAHDPKDRFSSVRDFAIAFEQACQQGNLLPDPRLHDASPSPLSQPLSFSSPAEHPTPSFSQESSTLTERPLAPTGHSEATPTPPGWHSASDPEPHWSEQRSWSTSSPTTPAPSNLHEPAPAQAREAAPGGRLSRRIVLIAGSVAGITIAGGALSALALEEHARSGLKASATASATSRPSVTPTITPTPSPPGTTLLTYRGHINPDLTVAAWSPDGTRIASGGADETVQVWDAANGNRILVFKEHSGSVLDAAWSPDGKRIASGSTDNTVLVWDAADGSGVLPYLGHRSWVRIVAWSPDGKRIASGGSDKTVQVWDTTHGSTMFSYTRHAQTVYSTSWSPNGKWIASGGDDHTLQVWDAANGSQHFPYRANIGGVYQTAWSPDGTRIASASGNRLVQVWDATTGGLLFMYRGHTNVVWTAVWSPDGKRIASGGSDHTVQIWDAADGGHVFTYRGHTDRVRTVAWSPDGKRIVSASSDGTVQIWQAG